MADSISATLASISQATARSGFELQFSNLQNSLIRRFNDQVDKINDEASSSRREIDSLQAESARLVDTLPVIEQYRIGNQNNFGQLEKVQEDLTTLRAILTEDNTLTADEVTAFEAKRDEIAERVNNIFVFFSPDIVDGQPIQTLKEELDAFKALTPVAGSVDVDNAGLLDSVDSFITKTSTATTVTSNNIETALDLEIKVQTDFSNIDAELLELTFEEQERRNNEIESLRIDLGNTLRAISLSFEFSSDLSNQLNSSLREQTPAPGSVLNFFT